MNKYDLEKSLRTLREADRELTAQYQAKAKEPATASPRRPKPRPIPSKRQQLLPNEFPPKTHPDDWEPDCEGDRGPVVPEFQHSNFKPPAEWTDNF